MTAANTLPQGPIDAHGAATLRYAAIVAQAELQRVASLTVAPVELRERWHRLCRRLPSVEQDVEKQRLTRDDDPATTGHEDQAKSSEDESSAGKLRRLREELMEIRKELVSLMKYMK